VTVLASPPKEPTVDGTQDLFEEARHRRRRRRLVVGVVLVTLLLGGVIAGLMAAGGGGRNAQITATRPHPTPAAVAPSKAATPGATELAWIASGGLHLGSPSQGTNHLVPQTSAATATRLLRIGSRVYFLVRHAIAWRCNPEAGCVRLQTAGSHVAVFDTRTGRLRSLGTGINLTTTTDGRDLLVALNQSHLVELSPTGVRLSRVWTIPSGYSLDTYAPQHPVVAVADGIVIQSTRPTRLPSGEAAPDSAYTLAFWDPTRGSVRILGRDLFVIGSYTAPRAKHSLVAWVDGAHSGRLALTDTATFKTRLVTSPLSSTDTEFGNNFLGGGGFSPDGRQLAAFVTAFRPHDWPNAQLVLVNPTNGSVRLVGNTVVQIGEPQGWATWSPSGRELFGGSYREGSVIQAFELKAGQNTATLLSLDRNANDDVTGSAVAVQGGNG
jgi:hypothetical protein